MATAIQAAPASKKMLWAGSIVSALPILLFTFSSIAKFVNPPGMAEQFNKLGLGGCPRISTAPRSFCFSPALIN